MNSFFPELLSDQSPWVLCMGNAWQYHQEQLGGCLSVSE